jgi:hypothetical protein
LRTTATEVPRLEDVCFTAEHEAKLLVSRLRSIDTRTVAAAAAHIPSKVQAEEPLEAIIETDDNAEAIEAARAFIQALEQQAELSSSDVHALEATVRDIDARLAECLAAVAEQQELLAAARAVSSDEGSGSDGSTAHHAVVLPLLADGSLHDAARRSIERMCDDAAASITEIDGKIGALEKATQAQAAVIEIERQRMLAELAALLPTKPDAKTKAAAPSGSVLGKVRDLAAATSSSNVAPSGVGTAAANVGEPKAFSMIGLEDETCAHEPNSALGMLYSELKELRKEKTALEVELEGWRARQGLAMAAVGSSGGSDSLAAHAKSASDAPVDGFGLNDGNVASGDNVGSKEVGSAHPEGELPRQALGAELSADLGPTASEALPLLTDSVLIAPVVQSQAVQAPASPGRWVGG